MTNSEISAIINQVRDELARGTEGLVFDPEPHKYFYNGQELKSVSEMCELFTPKFDTKYWSERKAQETGLSAQEIKKQWEKIANIACDQGSFVHLYGEYKFYEAVGLPIVDPELLVIEQMIKDYSLPRDERMDAIDSAWDWLQTGDHGYKLYPVAAEARIVNPKAGYAGTFDLLFLRVADNDEVGLVIFDYKTNGNLFNIFKSRTDGMTMMHHPLTHMANCNAAHYACQLSMYQMGLERVTSIPIVDRMLLWVNPTGSKAIRHNTKSVYDSIHRRQEAEGIKSKWKWMAYNIAEISQLKRVYNFQLHGNFSTLSLPAISKEIESHLMQH